MHNPSGLAPCISIICGLEQFYRGFGLWGALVGAPQGGVWLSGVSHQQLLWLASPQ